MYISQWGEFCLNWVGHKILSLFPGTQHSVKQKINTTYLLSNVSVLNLGSLQTPIFDLQEATIMVSGVFLNISPTQVTPKHLSNIHPKRQSLKTKEVVLLMGILFLISKTQKRETSMNISCVLSRTASPSAGLSRINQSIESFCYAILGSQVDVRSSIASSQGSAIETQRQFLSMVEDAIQNPDISKSVQRFQLAIESAKVRLDLAISPGLWLLPSKMVVNTESVVGYNNKLKKAMTFMRFGVNSDLNIPVRRSTQKHTFGRGAVKLPHSGVERKHIEVGTSENKVTADAEPGKLEKAKQQAETKETQVVKSEKSEKSEAKTVSTSHENNLNVLIIIAGVLSWFLFRWSASWRKNEKNEKKMKKCYHFFFLIKTITTNEYNTQKISLGSLQNKKSREGIEYQNIHNFIWWKKGNCSFVRKI